MIAIIDYDAGNIRSVEKAMAKLGQEVWITRDRERIMNADKVILPGVGSFGDAMAHLREYNLVEVIKDVVAEKNHFLESVWDCSFCMSPVKRLLAWRDSVF